MTEHATGDRPGPAAEPATRAVAPGSVSSGGTGPLAPGGTGGGKPPWSVLCEPDALLLHRPGAGPLRTVPAGRQVALALDGPLARWRLRRLARRCGVRVDRELIAVPSTTRPVAVFDDEESAVRHFWTAVVTVPPGVAGPAPLLTVALRLARRMPWSWTGALAPTRIIIGRRT
ncbi:MAG: hypothetical protein ACTHOK_15840 [Nocardioidaceae bacterium]